MAEGNIKFSIGRHKPYQNVAQKVDFFYATNALINSAAPDFIEQKISYSDFIANENAIAVFNYDQYQTGVYSLTAPAGLSQQGKRNWNKCSIFKREIWYDEDRNMGSGQALYKPVVETSEAGIITDYNIANNRLYEYVIYPYSDGQVDTVPTEIKTIAETKWDFWTITELHPTKNKKIFTAKPEDVWMFRYNVEPSEQRQNMAKTQQDNLSQYPIFSRGRKNNISGSLTALIGQEMLPWNWTIKKRAANIIDNKVVWNSINFGGQNSGGYIEAPSPAHKITSNDKIDLLNAWRKISYSGNPKLLKDMKGQKFLIQIVESSNTPHDKWNRMPDTITFSWVEIGNAEDIQVYQESN